MFCASANLQVNTETGEALKPLPCRSWTCEYCQPKRHKQLIATALGGRANKMLTLTVNPEVGDGQTHRRILLHDAWTKLRKRMMRKLQVKSIPYLAFVEKTKAGEPHLHILLRCPYIHYKWYQRQMRELLQSPIIWIEKIRNTNAAAFYVTKYCAKAPAQFARLKRYWQSRDWDARTPDEKRRDIVHIKYERIIRQHFREIATERLFHGWAARPRPDDWVEFLRPSADPAGPGYIYYSPGDYRLRSTAETLSPLLEIWQAEILGVGYAR